MRQHTIILAICIIISVSSCNERMYFPSRASAPGLREKYDTKLVISGKIQVNSQDSSDNTSALAPAIDFAFSPIEHLGITASYNGILNRGVDNDPVYSRGGDYATLFNGYRFDGGIGYYQNFGRLGFYEIYGGYGGGYISRKGETSTDYDFTSHYHRVYIQPAAGIGNKMFLVSGGLRLAYQRFYDFQSANPDLRYTITSNDGTAVTDITAQNFLFIEPFINAEIGYKFVKVNFQVGFSGQVTGGPITGEIPMYMSLGIVLNYAPRFFKKDVKTERHRRGHFSDRE